MATSLLKNIVWVGDLSHLQEVAGIISKEACIALHCEGYNLGRNGTLDIITIAVQDKTVYFIDITRMGRKAFQVQAFKDILEGEGCEKLMFDCRDDADSLWHIHQVKLGNVLDLQLLEMVHRTAGSTKPNSAKNGEYWQLKARSVNILWGYKKCLGVYLKDEDLVSIKDKGAEEILASKAMTQNVRAKRPLTDTLKKYCAVNTQVMFTLWDILSTGQDLSLVKAASGRYVDYRRSYITVPSNKYSFHAYLPHNILDLDSSKKRTRCTGCMKMFASRMFSKRTKAQKGALTRLCWVCKRVERGR